MVFVLQNWWFEFIPKTFCKIEIGKKYSNVLKRFVKSKLVRHIQMKSAPLFILLLARAQRCTTCCCCCCCCCCCSCCCWKTSKYFCFCQKFWKKRENLFLEKIIVKKICQILLLSPWLTSVFRLNSKFKKFLEKNTKYFFLYRNQPKPWYMT